MNKAFGILTLFIFLLVSCDTAQEEATSSEQPLFSELEQSGLNFRNDLSVTDSMNFFTYGYFYMGGGVAIADFNADGLDDVFFTGNMVDNKLYLNKGELQFDDITADAGIQSQNKWYTGVTVADVNQDGLQDIYISVAGKWASRKNELWINLGSNEQGIPEFKEAAAEHGIADESFSIQSVFFDYDNDGDLDLLVGTYEPTPFNSSSLEYRKKIDDNTWAASDHLYENDGTGKFTDITAKSGIQNFGLTIGVLANDFNQDGHVDLYLSNDFNTPDRFFINNGDGTFRDEMPKAFSHTSYYGMGIDAADYNQDGHLDIFQLDMSPADNFRSKANMASMDIPGFWNNVKLGYHYQYMYNSLQTYQGMHKGVPFYGDQAKLSGMESTDWSWACLFGDYDNDGLKDLYITNGTRKDINNKDYFNWLERIDISLKVKYKELSLDDLMERMPSKKVDNYMFKNVDGSQFKHINKEWGIERADFSNGLAYGDLDNDGDLELVVNNIDTTASIFKNWSAERANNNFVSLDLQGEQGNINALGAKLWLHYGDKQQYHEHTRTRGFQSAVSNTIHFGIGEIEGVDSLVIEWPGGKREVKRELAVNTKSKIIIGNAEIAYNEEHHPEPYFKAPETALFNWSHKENDYNDFDREILLPHQMSSFGPALCSATELNGEHTHVFMGGAKGQKSTVITIIEGKESSQELEDEHLEANAGLFFDADKDGDLDLLLGSGGSEEEMGADYYKDQFYINDKGQFRLSSNILPEGYLASCSVLRIVDFDLDGDSDVFIGGRQIPGKYPMPAHSYILENKLEEGELKFDLAAASFNEALMDLGMVTDAQWNDLNQDGKKDLILVGEWMNPKVFHNDGFRLTDKSEDYFKEAFVGWWNTLELVDLNNDGLEDLVLGNLGDNYKYKVRGGKTFDVYANDFDENGNLDIVLGYFEGDTQYPVRGKQCSSEQVPDIKKQFRSYDAFASSDLEDIYGKESLEGALHYKVNAFKSMIFIREERGGFKSMDNLPTGIQQSSVNSIEVIDVNKDGFKDLILAGNLFDAEIETPRADASYGLLLLNKEGQSFELISNDESGLYIPFENRALNILEVNGETWLLAGNNNAELQCFKLQSTDKKKEQIAEYVQED